MVLKTHTQTVGKKTYIIEWFQNHIGAHTLCCNKYVIASVIPDNVNTTGNKATKVWFEGEFSISSLSESETFDSAKEQLESLLYYKLNLKTIKLTGLKKYQI